MLLPSAAALLTIRDRSPEQPMVTGYATDPSGTARSASPSYQRRVALNHQLSSTGRLAIAGEVIRGTGIEVILGTGSTSRTGAVRAPDLAAAGRP